MPTHISHQHATKTTKPGRIYDTHRGLHLWVKASGAKYWIYRKTQAGRRHEISLGSFPTISVADARKKASEAEVTILKGESPGQRAATVEKAHEQPAAPVITFSKFAVDWLEKKRPEWKNAKHAEQWTNTLRDYAFPTIGDKQLSDISTDDVMSILNPIWLSKTETATRVRGRIERVLAAATIKGLRTGVNPAQWRGHLDCLLPQPKKIKRVRHHPALPYAELPAFITELHGREGVAAIALEFCILTAARTGEVIYAERAEIVGDTWIVPADRMKAGREHKVPLTARAQLLIERGIAMDPDSKFVFSREGTPLCNLAMLALLDRMKYGHVTVHGFRSAFRDWVSEATEHSSEAAEMSLAHTIANRVESAYRRGDLVAKRRLLMEDWAAYCLGEKR